MLKRISVKSLQSGMHLHALEGSWLDHGLWRTNFLVTTEDHRRAVASSGAKECWIDLSKGSDIASAAPDNREAQPATPVPLRPERHPGASAQDRVPEAGVSFEAELIRASRICKVARQGVQKLFGELRLGKALDVESLQPLVEEISGSVFRNPGALVNLARLKTKDDYTYMHSVAVCALMVMLARGARLSERECREAGLAGLLHDVGKAVMPVDILNKPGKLTDDEFDVIRTHPVRGHEILLAGGAAAQGALDVCLHHHEHVDGTGYPHKLNGDRLSMLARMSAICDVYDAVTSARPYKAAWDPADALSRMATWTGHFDASLFATFVQSLGIYPSGSLVRLRSGKLAIVVKQHPTILTLPTVKVFYSTKSDFHIPVVELDLAQKNVSDSIVCRESRSSWNFGNLDQLWTQVADHG